MKILLAIVFATVLTGCFQRINVTEIKQAEKYCADKLGIREITEYAIGSTVIYCISGDAINPSHVSLIYDDSSGVK